MMTTFLYATQTLEGDERRPLYALYPHQWRNTDQPLLPTSYDSVRGRLKLESGLLFRTSVRFPGILPCLPVVGDANRDRIVAELEAEAARPCLP